MSVQEHEQLWGGETSKALDNFPISGERVPASVIHWLGRIKAAAARVNRDLGLLDDNLAERIAAAGDRVAEGEFDEQFPLDVFQTGSGTSSNMNANEVIANRAIQILGGVVGSKSPVHPNDHVNLGQSSNDVFPTAAHIAAIEAVDRDLIPALRALEGALAGKAASLDYVVKLGRTHLMDAVPIRLGQEFSGYAAMLGSTIRRVEATRAALSQLALGGTAVGTGLGADPDFAPRVIRIVAKEIAIPLRQAPKIGRAHV